MSKSTPSLGFISAMIDQPRGMLRWLGKLTFDKIQVNEEAEERLRASAKEGQLVYVMRTRSLLDYLFFNYLFLKVGVPLARFANGVDPRFFGGVRAWLSDVWRRITRKKPRDPAADVQLRQTVETGGSALLFLKARALTSEQQASPRFIQRLVELQLKQEAPILLVPQLIVWPRKPPSMRRSWIDILFGDQETPGRLRKLGHFLRHVRAASVQVGEPINLKAALSRYEGSTTERIARKMRGVLYVHLGREAMAVHGPHVKPGTVIRKEVLGSPHFRRELERLARRLGTPLEMAREQARKALHDIAALTSFQVLLIFARMLDFVFNRIYEGVEVDQPGMRRVKEAAKLSRTAPLVLVPSHKSHIDYLVISWIFLRNEFIPPHIAAGANLSFFPLGPLLRRSGAFFLPRTFVGREIEKLVFRAYLWKLVREGYPVEFFAEGGRSRTGKLLPPKLGMLNMLMDGIRQGLYQDLQFVPINLNYERVVESSAYRRELTGAEKEPESVAGVVKASRVLGARYGRVYVSFEKPVRLSEYLAQTKAPDLTRASEQEVRERTTKLAFHLMRRIQDATIVTASALVATVLLSHHRRGMSSTRLIGQVGFLLDFISRRGGRFSGSIKTHLEAAKDAIAEADADSPAAGHQARGRALLPVMDKALALLTRSKLIDPTERDGETIYLVPERSRIELDYYRNNLIGLIAPEAMVATVLRSANRPISKSRFSDEVRKLSRWMRLEFIYASDVTFEVNFERTVRGLVDEGFIEEFPRDDTVMYGACAPQTLDFLRGTMLHLVEGYWIAADALRGLAHNDMDKKAWVASAREHGEREFLEGDIRRAEAASQALLANALELFLLEKLVDKESVDTGGRRPQWRYALTEGVTLDDVAYRRDDIGLFLAIRQDEIVPRPASTLPRTPTSPPEPERSEAPSTEPGSSK